MRVGTSASTSRPGIAKMWKMGKREESGGDPGRGLMSERRKVADLC